MILYDRLIPSAALDGARADAELLFVGKEGGGPSVPQEQTEALMIERAQAGRTVVRLKGGDPFVFGRGGEEALALRAAGIDFEVVPGVTAGVAASAYAGIPVTHRGLARAVALVTGQTREEAARDGEDGREEAVDWDALAAFPGTLVLYMGVRRLDEIARALIDAGRPASQPAAVVEAGTLPAQRTVSATLGTIAETARREQVRAPAITVVGAVAALAEELAWLPPRPLRGVTVAVTRARAQASGLARRLEALGASVIQAPVIRVQQLIGPHARGARPLAVRPHLRDQRQRGPGAVRAPRRRHAPARRRARARRREDRGDRRRHRARAGRARHRRRRRARALRRRVARAGARRHPSDAGADRPRARGARRAPRRAARARRAGGRARAVRDGRRAALAAGAAARCDEADYVTFTSSSTVRFFLQAAGDQGAGLSPATRIVSIGPVTSAALREHGLEPNIEADPYDVEGMIAALLADAAPRATDGR